MIGQAMTGLPMITARVIAMMDVFAQAGRKQGQMLIPVVPLNLLIIGLIDDEKPMVHLISIMGRLSLIMNATVAVKAVKVLIG